MSSTKLIGLKGLSILAIACLSAGCTHKGIKPLKSFHKDSGLTSVNWAYMNSNYRQSVIIVKPDGMAYILSEPAPDTAVKASVDVGAKLSYEGVTAETQVKYATEVTQLAKRTVAVSVLRDALYKLSELRAAGGTIKPEEIALFQTILSTAENIALAETIQSKADLVKQLDKTGSSLSSDERATILDGTTKTSTPIVPSISQ